MIDGKLTILNFFFAGPFTPETQLKPFFFTKFLLAIRVPLPHTANILRNNFLSNKSSIHYRMARINLAEENYFGVLFVKMR